MVPVFFFFKKEKSGMLGRGAPALGAHMQSPPPRLLAAAGRSEGDSGTDAERRNPPTAIGMT